MTTDPDDKATTHGKAVPPMRPTFAPPDPPPARPSAPPPARPSAPPSVPQTKGVAGPSSSTWAAPHRAPTGQTRPSATDATRYLCVAVQLNSNLSGRAVDSVLKEPHRAVAFSPGVDLACVLRYALAARARQATVQVLLALVSIGVLASLALQPFPDSSETVLPVPLPPLVVPLLLVAWAIVLAERLITFYGVLRAKLSRDSFDPDAAPRANPDNETLLRHIAAPDRQGNVSVFAGFDPFLGYGRLANPWNFTIAVDRPDEQSDHAVPFTVRELTTEVTGALQALGLPGVAVSERVFVNGADLAQRLDPALHRLLLPRPDDRPQTELRQAVIDKLWESGSGPARPYLVATVSGWNGELVAGFVIRFSLSTARDLLFVEGGSTLLPPLQRRYHQVDHLLDRPTWWQLLALVNASALAVPGQLVVSPFRVCGLLFGGLADGRKEKEQLRQIALGAFNHGAELSLRELAAETAFHRYFQQVDSQMYTKIVERRVLDTLTDFLADRQVDVSELRERQSVIYNGGVFASGNANVSFVNSPVAAGAGSKLVRLAGRAAGGMRKEGR
ncbi:hypothetical protein [Kitasatospora sp. CB01950]|uniref:hypothetical protein n=1 Tax=Kitasatospora sp. CB01950 TaxID=1703930 RepID=UPI00093E5CE2|nr:hypothetical protein [Kitasatospora sp. CB01950]